MNKYWNLLCELADKFVEKHGCARPEAFAGACAERPEWAAAAVDPQGKPVVKTGNGRNGTRPLVVSEFLSADENRHASEDSEIVRECKRLAGETQPVRS